MTPQLIYWVTRLDCIKGGLLFLGICLIIGIFAFLSALMEDAIKEKKHKVMIVSIICILFTIIFSGLIFIPTTKEMIVILTLPKVINNKNVKNISKYSLEVVEEWLKNQLNDLKNNIKEGVQNETKSH